MCINKTPPDPLCHKIVQKITVVKTDSAGTELWRYEHNNGGYIDQLGPVYEVPDGKGFMFYAIYDDIFVDTAYHYIFVQLNADGKIIRSTDLEHLQDVENVTVHQTNSQLKSMVIWNNPRAIVFFEINGYPVEKRLLSSDYSIFTQTSENSFIAIRGRSLVKLDASGNKTIWEIPIPNSTVFGNPGQIIQTNDGGYMIISNIQKSSTTWP